MAATKKSESMAASVFFSLGTSLMILAILFFGKPVLIPIALSVLLAFILNPLVGLLESWKLGRILSVLIASVLAFGLIGVASWALATQLKHLADDLPNHTHEIKSKIAVLGSADNSTLGRLTKMVEEIFPTTTVQASGESVSPSKDAADEVAVTQVVVAMDNGERFSSALQTLTPIVEPLATTALVIVLVLFLLIRREDMRYRVISLMGDSALTGTTRLMRDTAERVSSYLLNLLLVNAVFGLWFGVGLYLMGVPYAPLWGFLTLFFRFIPFLGSPASVLFPLMISIATSQGWSQPMWILIFFGISELATANVIEPLVFGKTTGLTPIALLIAALFWAWIWGPIGLLLSTPLTVCLVVLGQHIPHLRSLKVLLAEQPVLDARLQYFQRLLAGDTTEARRVFGGYVQEFDQTRAFDEVILPALQWTRRERIKDAITTQEELEIWRTNKEIVTELREQRLQSTADEPTNARKLSGYGYPIHHESEEIALMMLQELLADVCQLSTCSTKKLPKAALAEMQSLQPDIVVLTLVPPGGLPQVKYMCCEVAVLCPNTQIMVAFLGPIGDYDELLVNLRNEGAAYLTTSLLQTKHQVCQLFDSEGAKQAIGVVDAMVDEGEPMLMLSPHRMKYSTDVR